MPYRYFKQTGYYEGDFQGETFQRIPKTWLGKACYFWLRKLDKLQNGWKSKKRFAPKPSIKKTQSFQNDFRGAGCP
jgi:hypothetical protein